MVEKRERLERVTELQRAITAERYEGQIGRTVRAIVDRAGEGRTLWQADDIDGITRLRGDAAPGAIVEARITEVVDDYDFAATVERVIMAPAVAPDAARSRALPVLSGVTNGSFGR
jgi:ribosomal protein S12 methylthiotransferase